MVCVGPCFYLGYVPVNCVLFDRLIAAVGSVATAEVLIYVADASGYLRSVTLLLYKSFSEPELSWSELFTEFSYVMAAVCGVLSLASGLWFHRRTEGG